MVASCVLRLVVLIACVQTIVSAAAARPRVPASS